MDCNKCGETSAIPYIVYESECARHDRSMKRMIIIIILCVCFIVLSNLAWLYVWNQYDYVDETIKLTTDGGGDANYIGEDGNITNYGNDTSKAENAEP